jgi:hypothetical protein
MDANFDEYEKCEKVDGSFNGQCAFDVLLRFFAHPCRMVSE